MNETVTTTGVFRFKGPFRRYRERVVNELIKQGVNSADAEAGVAQIGDGKLLEWILAHGDDILALVLKIISLFK